MSNASAVISPDGTRIGYERLGHGPGLILLHGATADRTRWAGIAPALAQQFTLYLVDRRGRGLSADGVGEYAVGQEADDLLAVARAIGGPVALLGHSYGALISLEALSRDCPFSRVMLYEPPLSTDGLPVLPSGAIERIAAWLEKGDRDGLLTEFFRTALGLDDATIQSMRDTPIWRARLAAAPTIVRESRVANTYGLSPRLAEVTVPVRFLLGTHSATYAHAATRAAHQAIPGSDVVELPGQAHMAMDTAPAAFLRTVTDFFALS